MKQRRTSIGNTRRRGRALVAFALLGTGSTATAASSAQTFDPEIHTGRMIVKLADLGSVERAKPLSSSAILKRVVPGAAMQSAYEWKPLFAERRDGDLLRQRLRGEARVGHALPDLRLFYVLTPKVPYAQRLQRHAVELSADPSFEAAYLEARTQPTAADIPPTTPLHSAEQGYLNAAPEGVDAKYAWTVPGGKGGLARLIHADFAWEHGHEDLKLPELGTYGSTPPSDTYYDGHIDHGTQMLGIVLGQHNAYGVDGIAPDVLYGTWGGGPVGTYPADVLAQLYDGGVLLISRGQGGNVSDGVGGCVTTLASVAIETAPEWIAIIQIAVANGTVVIETAGNADIDLGGRFDGKLNPVDPRFVDSGAIIVGARQHLTENRIYRTFTPGMPSCFTNFGLRVDVSAWGDYVFTTSAINSNFPRQEDSLPLQRYHSGFGGTSSASAIVGGIVASLQSIQLARGGSYLDSRAMRKLLKIGATPHVPDVRQVGGMPNMRAMHEWMVADADGDATANVDELVQDSNPNFDERFVAVLVAISSLD